MAEAGQRIALLLGAETVLHGEYGVQDGALQVSSGSEHAVPDGALPIGSGSEHAVQGGALPIGSGSEYAAPGEVLGVVPDAALTESTRLTLEVGDEEELRARGQRLTETGLLLDRSRAPFELGDEPRPLDRELGEFVASLGAPAGGRRGRRAQRVTMGKQASP